MRKAIALVLMISFVWTMISPAYTLSAKMKGKISMILILSLIGAINEYLNYRNSLAIKRTCKELDLGRLQAIQRRRHYLDLIEIRIYERGIVTIKDGVICHEKFRASSASPISLLE